MRGVSLASSDRLSELRAERRVDGSIFPLCCDAHSNV
jgi:hypothetical protein